MKTLEQIREAISGGDNAQHKSANDYHQKMSKAHTDWHKIHSNEVKKSLAALQNTTDDRMTDRLHNYARDHDDEAGTHYVASDNHKAAQKALNNHGLNSNQYKNAKKQAIKSTKELERPHWEFPGGGTTSRAGAPSHPLAIHKSHNQEG